MWGLIFFMTLGVWVENVRLTGSLNIASGIIGWVAVVGMIVGGVGWRVSSRRLKRARRQASMSPAQRTMP
jgi:hypothetical protein